jgi:VanZ family protein
LEGCRDLLQKRMKRAVVLGIAILILIGISPRQLSAQGDKFLHFGLSLICGAASESVLHYATDWRNFYKVSLGTALGTLPGLVKEIVDSTQEGNQFSGRDLAADFGGALCGAILSNVVNNLIQVNIKREKRSRSFVLSLSYSF